MNKPFDYVRAEREALRRGRISRALGTGVSLAVEAGAWGTCLAFLAAAIVLVRSPWWQVGALHGTLPSVVHAFLLVGMLQSVLIAFTFGAWRRTTVRIDRFLDAMDGQQCNGGKP